MEILVKLNPRGVPDALALEQLFAWAQRVEQGSQQGGAAVSNAPEAGDADSEGEGSLEGDVAEAEAQIENGGVATPKKKRGRRSNAEIAAEMAATKAQAEQQAAQAAATAVPPVNLGQVLPPGYVAPGSVPVAAVPPAAVAAPVVAATNPAAAPAVSVAAAFPAAQPAAMPAVPPAPAGDPGQPSLEDLRAVALSVEQAVGKPGTVFLALKPYGVYQIEKIPADKRGEVIGKLLALMPAA